MEKIARGHGREANIAHGSALTGYCTGWFIRTDCEGASWGH